MIPRQLTAELHHQLREFPVVTVIGPRQAGKTTLVRHALPEFDYISLEDPDTRRYASEDPRAFLSEYPRRVIIDEIQRVPELLSYLQGVVDTTGDSGQFVLTGSHQLELRAAIGQSLAGRTGILHLLPLSIAELVAADLGFASFADYALAGFLPRLYDKQLRPHSLYSAYYQTYVERDVRQLIQLKDTALFEKLIKLLAGRVGQLLNYQSLANDIGVNATTVKQWLAILEASFVVFKLPPYFENFGKRAIKSPKYYFTDTGLLCYLLNIRDTKQLERDPLVGHIFENLVVLEALKTRYNQGETAGLYFYRDSHGKEVDLLWPAGGELHGCEIKSAQTWHNQFKANLQHFSRHASPLAAAHVVYRGDSRQFSDGIRALRFDNVASLFPQ